MQDTKKTNVIAPFKFVAIRFEAIQERIKSIKESATSTRPGCGTVSALVGADGKLYRVEISQDTLDIATKGEIESMIQNAYNVAYFKAQMMLDKNFDNQIDQALAALAMHRKDCADE